MTNSQCPLTVAEQKRILQYKQEGWSLKRIAAEMLCSIYTVCKHWRRQRDHQATKPRGRPRSGTLSSYSAEVVEEDLKVKQEHPG